MQFSEKVKAALAAGRKLDAIKYLREENGMSLAAAKDSLETGLLRSPRTAQTGSSSLPEKVREALDAGHKLEAIKRMRAHTNMGLAEAKAAVEACIPAAADRQQALPVIIDRQPQGFFLARHYPTLLTIVLLLSLVWMGINMVALAGNLIVIYHREGYQPADFIIDRVFYQDDAEAGLSWGFAGRIAEHRLRMLAPELAAAGKPKLANLKKRYPPGSTLKVLYNPGVTDTLFQYRSLHIIPYVADILQQEKKQIRWWLQYCMLPFVIALGLSVCSRKQAAAKSHTPANRME